MNIDKRVSELALELARRLERENGTNQTITAAFLSELPEFQPPQWIKCSERMPEYNACVYFYSPNHGTLADWYGNRGFQGEAIKREIVTHWMPRHVPAPPVEEESELVKQLKRLSSTPNLADVLLVVKKYERDEKARKE